MWIIAEILKMDANTTGIRWENMGLHFYSIPTHLLTLNMLSSLKPQHLPQDIQEPVYLRVSEDTPALSIISHNVRFYSKPPDPKKSTVENLESITDDIIKLSTNNLIVVPR